MGQLWRATGDDRTGWAWSSDSALDPGEGWRRASRREWLRWQLTRERFSIFDYAAYLVIVVVLTVLLR